MNIRNFIKSELIRNTSVLVTGTVFAQLISLLLQPLLRRLFSVEQFGTYLVYMSMIGIVAVISSLRFDDAIVLPKKDKGSANLLFLAVLCNLVITSIVFLSVLLFGEKILSILNLPKKISVSILYLVPIGALLLNISQAFNYWLIRKKRYNAVSLNKFVRRGSEGIAQVSSALLVVPKGLIISDIIGQLANILISSYQSVRNGFSLRLISLNKVRYVAHKYSDFPKFNLIPAFMSTCSFFLPPIFIAKFYSAENAGYYDLARLLLSIPLAFIASSISNVLLQKVADRFNNKQSFKQDLKHILWMVLLICIAECSIIFLFGNWLFQIIGGPGYKISGEISKIMVWSFALNFFVTSFATIFISMRKIKIYSIWQFFYFFAILSLLFFKDLSFFGFLKTYVLIEVVSYITVILIMVKMVANYENSLKVSL